jgi:hypothetical protein
MQFSLFARSAASGHPLLGNQTRTPKQIDIDNVDVSSTPPPIDGKGK